MKIYVFDDDNDGISYTDIELDTDDIYHLKLHEMIQRCTIYKGRRHYIGVTYREGYQREKIHEEETFQLGDF
jgi:hypothetical protein